MGREHQDESSASHGGVQIGQWTRGPLEYGSLQQQPASEALGRGCDRQDEMDGPDLQRHHRMPREAGNLIEEMAWKLAGFHAPLTHSCNVVGGWLSFAWATRLGRRASSGGDAKARLGDKARLHGWPVQGTDGSRASSMGEGGGGKGRVAAADEQQTLRRSRFHKRLGSCSASRIGRQPRHSQGVSQWAPRSSAAAKANDGGGGPTGEGSMDNAWENKACRTAVRRHWERALGGRQPRDHGRR